MGQSNQSSLEQGNTLNIAQGHRGRERDYGAGGGIQHCTGTQGEREVMEQGEACRVHAILHRDTGLSYKAVLIV